MRQYCELLQRNIYSENGFLEFNLFKIHMLTHRVHSIVMRLLAEPPNHYKEPRSNHIGFCQWQSLQPRQHWISFSHRLALWALQKIFKPTSKINRLTFAQSRFLFCDSYIELINTVMFFTMPVLFLKISLVVVARMYLLINDLNVFE